jgi:chromate reductase, NAD(P)H dehydrogenase (quinone)
MAHLDIAVIIGSLREGALNRKLALALGALAPADLTFTIVEIGDLPLYNQDDDAHQAESVKRMKAQVARAQGLLFLTPEYNRSISGVLKNALDHGSRPYGANSWAGKPAAIGGISPGAIGTAVAQQHLRTILAALDVPVLAHPEIFLQAKDGFFNADGSIGDGARGFLTAWLEKFATFARRFNA